MKDLSKRKFFDKYAFGWDERNHPDDRLQIQKLIEKFELKPTDWILDVGTGNGILLPYLSSKVKNQGKIFALDFSWKMIYQAKKNNKRLDAGFLNASAEALPIKDQKVDCITCFSTFAHVCAPKEAIKEMSRVLKKGGRLYIAHLMGKKELALHHQLAGGAVEHDILPPDSEMIKMLKNSGLKDIKIIDQPDIYIASARK